MDCSWLVATYGCAATYSELCSGAPDDGSAEPNSPLYAVLARSLQLRHWVIADTESESWRHGYRIAPDVLVETVRSALALAAGEGLPAGSTKVELTRDEWL